MVHAHGNPGPGGWGAILMFNDVKKEMVNKRLEGCMFTISVLY